MKTLAMKTAFEDMQNEMKEQNIKAIDSNGDVYYVLPSRLNTKETRKLNREVFKTLNKN